ncbi:MAG: Crp/Fnr family transcriptional regulator [Betaproteobacteria bacterium]
MPKQTIRMQEFLTWVPLFKGLEAEQLARLARASSEADTPRGALLFRRGDPCTGLYAVMSGQIKLSLQTVRGDEMVVELAERGASFGEAPLFSGRPHILTAEALADSAVLHLPKDCLLAEMDRNPAFARRVTVLLGEGLYRSLVQFEEYLLASGTERVISFLLRGHSGDAARGTDWITFPANKGVIASRLNLTHEHFSRILRELMAEGLIQVEGREVRILNKQRLYGYAT